MTKNQNTSLAKRLWSNIYVKNILLAIIVFFVIIFISSILLNTCTRHGKSIPVPDFKGMAIQDAQKLAEDKDMTIEISDSIFMANIPAGAILEQNPKAESQVKKNRKIYVTINCTTPQKVEVPNVVGFSLRQAKSVLESKGIRVGVITYQSDMAMNNVLGQRCKDVNSHRLITNEDNAKAMVYLGDEVELVVGLGEDPSARYTNVPNVVGRTLPEAKSLLISSYLNLGTVNFDSTIKTSDDKRTAVVKSQTPSGTNYSQRYIGETVDVLLTKKP